ncbi:hypothetical protein QUF72_23000 [Desulfobacterales bacterium HSG2]|nr:hypothetical protein [Desulfobacterales bacterium HSG2]
MLNPPAMGAGAGSDLPIRTEQVLGCCSGRIAKSARRYAPGCSGRIAHYEREHRLVRIYQSEPSRF